jgi:hypothetical protein
MRGVVGGIIVAAILPLSACSGTGRFSATAICERSGGRYVERTCERESSPEELATKQWCQTHGGVYLSGNETCEWGYGQ